MTSIPAGVLYGKLFNDFVDIEDHFSAEYDYVPHSTRVAHCLQCQKRDGVFWQDMQKEARPPPRRVL